MRHDCVVNKLAGAFTDKGYTVETEYLFKLQNGNLKPDIVATISDGTRGRVSVICDVQIVSANGTEAWHADKVRKYESRADLKTEIRRRHQSTDVRTVAATLTWRGVWLPSSSRSLRALEFSTGVLASLATRAMRGTVLNWYSFNANNTRHSRTGVG
jgi:hypothetical protein